ncbi:hypothetical protein KKG31_07030 [Patescibacteria group bacterium]|nr:hypothetical protein [Patescibacteria group bacterium]MBU1758837.1 hypothetical protein [Patescibacteria group bacterium]
MDIIEKHMDNPAIFFAANFSENKEYDMCREIDEQWISDIIGGKMKKTQNNMISKLFSHYTKRQKKVPQVLAYTNTGDLG